MKQEIQTKECSKCHQIKPIDDFYKEYKRCKKCHQKYNKSWYIKNKITRNQQIKEYRLKNIEHSRHIKRQYARTHKKEAQERSHQHYLKNKTKIREKRRVYTQEKLKVDNNFKILTNYRIRMIQALKNNQKSGHTISLLMCSVEAWRKHLESQFTEGMSWDNYGNKAGQWSIDHIIPCDFFKDYLSDPVEQYMCFRWQNTRPMWHVDNVRKSNKI